MAPTARSLVAALCGAAVAAAELDIYSKGFQHLDKDPTAGFVSATLGDHMVLQSGPVSAVVWGHTKPGATVTTTFGSATLTATAGADGIWRQRLPPTPASMTAHTLAFASSAGEAAKLEDVLFGDVYVCGGQSNMQFAVPGAENATAEEALADKYPHIRLFTVGQGTKSSAPLTDLQTIEQKWAVASRTSLAGPGDFGYFSAVCWFFGRRIADAQPAGKQFPIGLISNNWGGTAVEEWSTTKAFEACERKETNGELYNAMINPYVVGPMAVTGFTWYQGEANVADDASAARYACLFPAMITEWRRLFGVPSAYFGFIQLSTWCLDNPLAVASLREAQMAALALPKVGYATNADHGAGCNIHPPPKQYCSVRLGDSALALQYGEPIAWRSPSYKAARAQVAGQVAVATIELQDVSTKGLTADVHPYNYVPGLDCAKVAAGNCVWGQLNISSIGWVNATVGVAKDGHSLELRAALGAAAKDAKVTGTAYGWGAIPMMNAYDLGTNLPVLPWRHPIAGSEASTEEVLVV